MKKTLTLDPDVECLLRAKLAQDRCTLKEAINDGLRRGLLPPASGTAFSVSPNSSALQPGFDPRGFNQLAEELEDEALVAKPVGSCLRHF